MYIIKYKKFALAMENFFNAFERSRVDLIV